MSYQGLPRAAMDVIKMATLDVVACALAGSRSAAGRTVARFAQDQYPSGRESGATVIGRGMTTSTLLAALANGTAAHAQDFDDSSIANHGHPSAAILPALLALAETRARSGADVIVAYAVGFELGSRVALALGPEHYARGWHTTLSIGCLRAALASARLLELDEDRTRIAMGIAMSSAGGTQAQVGTMAKPLHAGLACEAGVRAALLAEAGLTASTGVLEAQYGVVDMFGHDDGLRAPLEPGSTLAVLEPGIVFKPYPCWRGSHGAVEAVLELRRSEGLSLTDVDAVTVTMNTTRVKFLDAFDRFRLSPATADEARFSVEWQVAVALREGALGLREFMNPANYGPGEVREAMRRVEVRGAADLDPAWPGAAAELRTRDGRTLRSSIEVPRGQPTNPPSTAELRQKLRACAEDVLGTDEVDELARSLDDLEHLHDLGPVMRLLRGRADGEERLAR